MVGGLGNGKKKKNGGEEEMSDLEGSDEYDDELDN